MTTARLHPTPSDSARRSLWNCRLDLSLLGLGGLVRLGGLFGLRSLLAALRLRLVGRLCLVGRGQSDGKLERGILNVGSGRRCLKVGGRSLDGRLGLALGRRGRVRSKGGGSAEYGGDGEKLDGVRRDVFGLRCGAGPSLIYG